MSHPLTKPQVRRRLVLALVIGVAGVAVFVLGPTGELPSTAVRDTTGVLVGLGAPSWLTDRRVWEFAYNVVLFVPVAAVCAMLWRRVPLWAWVALGFSGSLAIESVQAMFLSGRTPQIRDLVANTLGALVGALLARLAWLVLHRTDPR